MAMDFPNSPIVGQIFTVNGKQWIWSGTSWNARTANTTFQGHAGTHAVGQSDAVTIAQSQVTNLVADIAAKSNIASPTFTGIPAAPTAAPQTNTTQIATTSFVVTEMELQTEIKVLDDIGVYFDGVETRFLPTVNNEFISITNQLRLLLTIDGIIQEVNSPDYTWLSEIPRWGFRIDYEGFIQFTEAPPAGAVFEARLLPGSETDTVTKQNPFKAVDILIGG